MHHLGDETHAGVERMWDIINTLRIGEMGAAPVSGLATDDSHNYFGTGGSSPGRGWVMVRSRFLTPESVIKAIEAGDFYASSGVTLKEVRFSPESKDAGTGDRAAGGRPVHDPVHRDAQGLRPGPEARRRTRTASPCR